MNVSIFLILEWWNFLVHTLILQKWNLCSVSFIVSHVCDIDPPTLPESQPYILCLLTLSKIYIYWNLTWNFPSIRCPKNPLWCYIYIYICGLCGCSNSMSSSMEWENSVGSNQKKTWVLSHSKLGRQSTHSEEDRA